MRTTINLPDDLLARLKKEALNRGSTMTELIEESLRESLARRAATPPVYPVKLKTVRGTGVLPGVDLDNSAALLDIMELDSDSP